MIKAEFSASLLQSSVSHTSEISETFLIIINIENIVLLNMLTMMHFTGCVDESSKLQPLF